MEGAEALCERVAIIDRGRVMAMDSPRELIRGLDFDNTVECIFAGPVERERLLALTAVRDVKKENGAHLLFTTDVSATLAGLMGLTDGSGERGQAIQVGTATLADVFISLTGRRLRN